jgi:S-methylmethionine-dependent homocysteine/selenocysteine methylase
MPYETIKARLDRGDRIILDGATGTELERRGVPMNEQAWCGLASLDHGEVLEQVHADYIAAGADVITTNTYASSRLMLGAAGMADEVTRVVRAATEAALRARDRAARGRAVAVAGSLSHMVPIVANTARTREDGVPSEAETLAAFREVAAALAASGCDLILLEMMHHPKRVPLAIRAAQETGLPVWLGLSARIDDDGRLLSYASAQAISFADIVGLVPESGIAVAGVMHSSVTATDPALAVVRQRFPSPLMAYPESGYFEMPHWRFVDVMSPEDFVGHCRRWSAAGVQVLGGCCGLGVEHIRALARAGIA